MLGWTGGEPPAAIHEMPGGASTRRYYRVEVAPGRSAVAMFVPDAAVSDEIVKGGAPSHRWPFLEVRELLLEHGVRVPQLLAEACQDGFILIEDLGDDTLANYLLRRPEQREILYRGAVADLAAAQRRLQHLPPESVIKARAFDHDLLRWEIDHFREWGLEARGIELSSDDRRLFDGAAEYLASTIASWPRGFVHRDYQSRNLMVRIDATGQLHLVWIDFQDALLGPRVYDLVALLNDSYQTFDRAFIERRLDEYAAALGVGAEERHAIGVEFDLVTVQRKLKDAGRFVFIDRKKHNPNFLQFVEPTIEKARAAIDRLTETPEVRALAGVLDRALGPRT